MKLLKNFLILVIVLIILALANWRYLGGFTKLEVKEQNMGPYTIAYMNFVGEYSKVGPSMTTVYTTLSGAGITSFTGIGIYYDDPAVVSGADLRSDIGALVASEDMAKVPQTGDIKTKTIPSTKSIVIEFPLKSSISYMAGVIKVYPVLQKYMLEKGYKMEVPMTELYDMAGKKIYYIAEIK